MADSYTTNLNLTKPEVGSSRDTWGTKTNGDWDLVDAVFAAAGSGTSVGLNVGSGKTITVAGTINATGTVNLDTAVVINDSGADKDVRIEGDTDANLLFTDASADAVGIGTNTPGAKLNVVANTSGDAVRITQTGSGNALVVEDSANPDSTPFVVDASGNVGIGTSSVSGGFQLYRSASAANMFLTGDGQNSNLVSQAYGSAKNGTVQFQRYQGSVASPTAVSTGDVVGDLSWNAYQGSTVGTVAKISGVVETFTGSTEYSGYLAFSTRPVTAGGTLTERLRINALGSVLIGTNTDTGAKLTVVGDQHIRGGYGLAYYNSDNSGYWSQYNSSGTFIFSNGSEKARIDSSGNLAIGVGTTPGARLDVKGAGNTSATYSIKVANSDGTVGLQIRNDGYVGSPMIYSNTNGNGANVVITSDGYIYRSTSSLKYKKNVQDADFGLSELLALRPVTYQGKSGSDTEQVFGGLIAEEVHDAGLTQFVQYADDGTPDALSYGNMVALCIKAIQELKIELDTAKAEIAFMRGT